jgi:WD40 repeat protein
MSELTEFEQKFLNCIPENSLKTSLALIRQANEIIWANEAPRIIKDYTDHGIEHSKRLIANAWKILDANDGKPLSSKEIYLLVAGIYLHDIGMQCDLNNNPQVKEKAEQLGAQFDLNFSARTSSAYDIEEQKSIRNNHQFLSAAFIDYAFRSGLTFLGQAAKSIPEELVADLMDICKYHSKLPITDCPSSFAFDPSQRKQFVAAILRFADELDIDGQRVLIEIVSNFKLDPQNSLYWWLHNRTKIIFIARNVVLLNIRLEQNDLLNFGSLIKETFISEFQAKNQPILNVLRQNGVPMAISAESDVVKDDLAEPLPFEIVNLFQIKLQAATPLDKLADEVSIWLRTVRYEVINNDDHNFRTKQMVASLDQGSVKQRVLVRCIGGEISADDVTELDKILDRKTPQGWLISDKRVSENARKKAAENEYVKVFTFSEFLREMVWGPYFNTIISMVVNERIPDLYVDLNCYKEEITKDDKEILKSSSRSLDFEIDNWLTERGKMHISLLGEFGTGKTWFCRHYAYRQLIKYLDDPISERLPLLITLRNFSKSMTVQQLINDALLEQYKLPFVGSAYGIFQEMNKRGKLLLILDGFDEMARQVDYQTVVDNFWQLAELVDENSKVILTSRTEYFHLAQESQKILSGEEFGRRTIKLSPPKFEVVHIEPFTKEQIREVILRRLGKEKGNILANRILKNQTLLEMASKPVLVELLLAALEEENSTTIENPAQVYLYATNGLLLRNIDTQRTFTSTADKIFFLSEIAWEMICKNKLQIHYSDIPDRINSYFGEKIKDQHQLDTWDFDLRNQTLLHRNAAGYYEFAHKSLAEFFVALKFATELGCLEKLFVETYREVNGEPCALPIKPKNILELTKTFGLISFSDERTFIIQELLLGMVDKKFKNKLWNLINETKGKSIEVVGYTGGNAATFLKKLGVNFAGINLERTILDGANLRDTDFSGTNFQGSSLKGVDFGDCTFENTNFDSANLAGIKIRESSQVNSIAWSPSGNLLASGGSNGVIKIWDAKLFKYYRELRSTDLGTIWNLSFSPAGNFLAAIGRGNHLYVWDVVNWQLSMISGLDTKYICSFVWSKDEKEILAIGSNGDISKINLHSKRIENKWHITDLILLCIAQNSLSNEIAIGGHEGIFQIHKIKYINRNPQLPEITKEIITSLCYSQDNSYLFVGVGGFISPSVLQMWSTTPYKKLLEINKDNLISERKPINNSVHDPRTSYIFNIAVSQNGHFLGTAGENSLAGIRELPSLNRIIHFRTPQHSICFSPDSSKFATGDRRGNILIWDIDINSKFFGKKIISLKNRINCKGLIINGAFGLDQTEGLGFESSKKRKNMDLLEFFANHGALIDENQKQVLLERKSYKTKVAKIKKK